MLHGCGDRHVDWQVLDTYVCTTTERMKIEELSISLPPPPMLPWPMQCATHANLGWRFNVSEPSSEDTDITSKPVPQGTIV